VPNFRQKIIFAVVIPNVARVENTDFPESLDMFPALLGWMPA
jgi:hypothetical protein